MWNMNKSDEQFVQSALDAEGRKFWIAKCEGVRMAHTLVAIFCGIVLLVEVFTGDLARDLLLVLVLTAFSVLNWMDADIKVKIFKVLGAMNATRTDEARIYMADLELQVHNIKKQGFERFASALLLALIMLAIMRVIR